MTTDINSLLKTFRRFGVNLGLERIKRLLADLGNPHHYVPIIHVAGTNGKGSVCAYLSSILTEAGYRVGRYTSPHLIDWTERICLNQQPIATEALYSLLIQVKGAIPENCENSPTQFEVITAAAWLYFAQQQVDIAVMEVGLGGRLDATNVCDHPLVSVITSLSREHWQRLGPTLADISREKAGILKPGCPAVIGPLPPEAKEVITSRIEQLGCPAIWVEPAQEIKLPTSNLNNNQELSPRWASYQSYPMASTAPKNAGEDHISQIPLVKNHQFDSPYPPLSKGKPYNPNSPKLINYPLPLLGQIQLTNSAIAIATIQVLRSQGWEITEEKIVSGMAKTTWLGRLQWTSWQNHPLLIDGAHNTAAAQALRQYIDTLNTPVTWLMGILSTKDHDDIFKALLRPKDSLHLVPVPDHSYAAPETLAAIAHQTCSQLSYCRTYENLETGLNCVIDNDTPKTKEKLIVLCGSLYLVGYFLQLRQKRTTKRD
ncbi:MAG: bifunctional folylpolyglutamate synthase/dihydrofolate synthase [Symploca sp. SIO3C6]|nr:bifunctional folylpolyglutamate synthase/dihydrofolate synthase [Symploca sp. SIO3C6]